MTKAAVAELLKLPPQERLEIAEILWKSVEPEEETRFLSSPAPSPSEDAGDLEIINSRAAELNQEAADVLEYQVIP